MDVSKITGCRQSYAPDKPHVKSKDIKALKKMLREIKAAPYDTPVKQGLRNDRLASLKNTLENCIRIVSDNLYTHQYSKLDRLETLVTKTDKLFQYNVLINEETDNNPRT